MRRNYFLCLFAILSGCALSAAPDPPMPVETARFAHQEANTCPATGNMGPRSKQQEHCPSVYDILSRDIQSIPARVWRGLANGAALPIAGRSICLILGLDRERVAGCQGIGLGSAIIVVGRAISHEMKEREAQAAAANGKNGRNRCRLETGKIW
ncbi:hypothetical protein PG984_003666 [Apiospora sp. TS-2023a]